MRTGKNLEGIAGIAWLGAVCNERFFSYGLSRHFSVVPARYIITAHEIGHNFGADHPDEKTPPVTECTNTIMPSTLTLDAELTFCQFSRKEIGAHVARNNHCLTTQSLPLPPPTGLKAATVSSFQIDLTWRDNSDNETGFRVHRRLNDSEDWVEIGRTNANATRFSIGGLKSEGLLSGPAFITGLRQNRQDRSNVAVQNAGVSGEESITLKVTVYSGDPDDPASLALPKLSLPPGGFHQYNRILNEAGYDNGYVRVERVGGTAPFYAYGVINDNFNSDGSFVFSVGQYSLFYNGVPYGSATNESAWIYGLQQNEENRSNLALVNTGEVDGSKITLEIDVYDGEGDSQPRSRSVVLGPRRWHQINWILGNRLQGYVQVRRVSGNNPFITYGVINDGSRRGQRSGDGAFLINQP